MRVETIFLSINARDFDAQAAWWATLIGRRHDDEPMPSCREWALREGVAFQVLDAPEGGRTAVSLRVEDLDGAVARLRAAGVAVPDPERVPGFDTLRVTRFEDPEGNPVSLLDGA